MGPNIHILIRDSIVQYEGVKTMVQKNAILNFRYEFEMQRFEENYVFTYFKIYNAIFKY